MGQATHILFIHWTPAENKSFDSMRVSANIERFEEPLILYIDVPNPFLKRNFFVLLNALSAKKVQELRLLVDFSSSVNPEWRKQLERVLFFCKEKKLPLLLCEKALPAFFAGTLKIGRDIKKELSEKGAKFLFIPCEGHEYSPDEILYFELKNNPHTLFSCSDLDHDDFQTPSERKLRIRQVKEQLLKRGACGK